MEICFQKKKTILYSEACPEKRLRALAADAETKLLTDCCRLAISYAEEEPALMPDWFSKRYLKFCKDMVKEKGPDFQKKLPGRPSRPRLLRRGLLPLAGPRPLPGSPP